MNRCKWVADGNQLYIEYHDLEWGVPVHNDRKLFEAIILDAFQAGLSWSVILNKRENFRKAFDNFNLETIASYNENKIQELLDDKGIIRNKLKVRSAVTNANAFLKIQKEYGSFDNYIWRFTNNTIITNKWKRMEEIPASTLESDQMSLALKRKGFKYVGTTICYAFMQAVGMVNDHTVDCFRYKEIMKHQ